MLLKKAVQQFWLILQSKQGPLAFLLLCLIPACARYKKGSASFEIGSTLKSDDPFIVDHTSFVSEQEEELFLRDQESRLNKVFIPLYNKRWIVNKKSDAVLQDMISIGYEVPLSMEELISIYCQQMDYFGWRLIKDFIGPIKSLLLFDTPERICVVDCSVLEDRTQLLLFVGRKGASLE